ncbi:uncharacterized protein [Dermacentor albipictus]|uniref:uncharacterized protein n=1 Tax=Dermacentor albipictus TaxID=60249 RepID=UPI0031FC25D9
MLSSNTFSLLARAVARDIKEGKGSRCNPVDKDLASLTVVQPPQITAAEDSREEQPVEGKKKRRRRRKSHSRKRSTAEVPSQESAAVTMDQSLRREVTVEAHGRVEVREVGAVASAAEHTDQISIGAAPTALISLPLNASRPVSNAHETVPQRLSITAKQSMVPTGLPSYATSAAPGAEIQPPSVLSSNASTEQEKQPQGSVSDESRLAPKVSARKVSVVSRMIRGSRSTTEGLKSQSPAAPRFSSLAKEDGATSTARWPEEDSEMGSSSGSRTGDKYTQTGDVIVYPRRSPFERRRPEVTKFVSPDESLNDILYDRGVTSPPTTASWSSSYPARSREASMSEGPATTSRFVRKKAAGKERDSDSIRDMSGSESIISFKQLAVKQEKSDIPALPEKKPMQKCPAPRRDTDVVDMVKDSLMENATARSGEGCQYFECQTGSITSPKVALNKPKPTCHEVGANVQAGVEVGEVEEFYEEVAEEGLNDSRRLSTGSSSRECLNISRLAAVSDEHAEKDGQQGTDVLKGNKKNCKMYFRRERQGDLVSFTGQVNPSDATNKALPTSVTGEEPNSRNTLPDIVSHTETSNKYSRRKEEHGKLDEGSSTSRMTSGQHGETNPPANTVVPPSSQSACVKCTRKSSKNVGEALEIPGKCGKNKNARTSASKSAPHEFRFEQQADTLLEVQPYSVAKELFGCICDGFQGYSPSEFLYSPPSSTFQFGEAAISSPNWSNTTTPGTTQVFAGPWPLLDPQSTTSRPNTESRRDNQGTQIPHAAFRNLNFQAVMKDRAMPLSGYENVSIRAEKAVANESRSKDSRSKGTLNDFATGTTRHGAQRDATSRRYISIDQTQHLLIETDDFTERTPQASRKDSTTSVASGRLQISRKASTASIDAGISQTLRKDSTASIQMGIPHASRKPSTASVDFARLQTGSKSGTRKTTSTEQETPCSTSRLRCGQSSPARRCQSHKCHHGGRHSCAGHSHCRTAKGLDKLPSPPEEPITSVDWNDAALVRLEQLLREENRLLRQEKQRREGQLRLRSLLEERDQLLSTLGCPTEDGQETQNALRGQANAVSKALAALDLTSGSPACRPNSQRGAKGVGPIRDDNLQDKTACSARNKSGAPTQAGTSSDSSPGKAAQRLQGSSRNSKRGKP